MICYECEKNIFYYIPNNTSARGKIINYFSKKLKYSHKKTCIWFTTGNHDLANRFLGVKFSKYQILSDFNARKTQWNINQNNYKFNFDNFPCFLKNKLYNCDVNINELRNKIKSIWDILSVLGWKFEEQSPDGIIFLSCFICKKIVSVYKNELVYLLSRKNVIRKQQYFYQPTELVGFRKLIINRSFALKKAKKTQNQYLEK